jgi:hypothetical protein
MERFLRTIQCGSSATLRPCLMNWLISNLVKEGPVEMPSLFVESDRAALEQARADVRVSMWMLQFMWAFLDEIGSRSLVLRRTISRTAMLQLWARYHWLVWEATCMHGFGSPVFHDELQQHMDCDSMVVVFDLEVATIFAGHFKYAQASAAVVGGNLRHLFLAGTLFVYDGCAMRELPNPADDDMGVILTPLIRAMEALKEILERHLWARREEYQLAFAGV